jgi:hypothetical protein
LKTRLVEGKTAPRYTKEVKKLEIKEAVITEQGMESNLPIVDLVMYDEQGNKYFAMTSGRIINAISAAIKGVNMRIHGVQEP